MTAADPQAEIDDLIERLRKEAAAWNDSWVEGKQSPVGALFDEAADALAALRDDAARYRYLRDEMPRPTDWRDAMWLRTGADLDEAIDDQPRISSKR